MIRTDFKNVREIIPKYIEKKIDKLLVLGCGELRHEMYLNSKYIFGIDWADDRLDIAKEKNNVVVIKYDILNLKDIIREKSFDSVSLFYFLEHLQKHDALELLKVLENIVKKQIIMYVPIQKPIKNLENIIKAQEERKKLNLSMGNHLSTWTPEELSKLGFIGEYSKYLHYPEKEMGGVSFVLKILKSNMVEIYKNNTKFNIDNNININDWFIKHYENWEPQTFKVIDDLLESDKTFIDVGSWIGPILLYVADKVKRIVAIDCDNVSTDILLKNLNCNNFNCKINIIKAALYHKNGKIYAGGGKRQAEWGSSEITILNTKNKKANKPVNAITIDTLTKMYNIDNCGFIKMDIEGGEYFIIKSMKNFLQKQKPILYISIHPHLLNNKYLTSVISNLFNIFPYIYDTDYNLLEKKETLYNYLQKRKKILNREIPSHNGHELICMFKKIKM